MDVELRLVDAGNAISNNGRESEPSNSSRDAKHKRNFHGLSNQVNFAPNPKLPNGLVTDDADAAREIEAANVASGADS